MKAEVSKQENGKYILSLSPVNKEELSKIGTESLYAAINLSEEDKKSLESKTSQAQKNLNKEIVDRILKGENISKSELDDILKEFVERSQEIDKLEDK